MYKKGKGKGKGKGKRGPPQGGKGDQGRYSRDTSAHAGKGQGQKPVCKHCLIKGHSEEDSCKKAAGLTQTEARRTRPARSLEHAQAQLNLINGTASQAPQADWVEQMGDRETGDRGMVSLVRDREVYALDFDLSVAEFAGSEWVEEQEDCSTLTAAHALG